MPKAIRIYKLNNKTIYVYKCDLCKKEIKRNIHVRGRRLYCNECREKAKNQPVLLGRKCRNCRNEIIAPKKLSYDERVFCSDQCEGFRI